MPRSALRIDERLLAAIADFDGDDRPIAQVNRLVGELATRLGLSRRSYEQVRTVVHAARNGGRVYGWTDYAIDISFRTRSPEAALIALDERRPLPERK